jgi:hypothetical protein
MALSTTPPLLVKDMLLVVQKFEQFLLVVPFFSLATLAHLRIEVGDGLIISSRCNFR